MLPQPFGSQGHRGFCGPACKQKAVGWVLCSSFTSACCLHGSHSASCWGRGCSELPVVSVLLQHWVLVAAGDGGDRRCQPGCAAALSQQLPGAPLGWSCIVPIPTSFVPRAHRSPPSCRSLGLLAVPVWLGGYSGGEGREMAARCFLWKERQALGTPWVEVLIVLNEQPCSEQALRPRARPHVPMQGPSCPHAWHGAAAGASLLHGTLCLQPPFSHAAEQSGGARGLTHVPVWFWVAALNLSLGNVLPAHRGPIHVPHCSCIPAEHHTAVHPTPQPRIIPSSIIIPHKPQLPILIKRSWCRFKICGF